MGHGIHRMRVHLLHLFSEAVQQAAYGHFRTYISISGKVIDEHARRTHSLAVQTSMMRRAVCHLILAGKDPQGMAEGCLEQKIDFRLVVPAPRITEILWNGP